MIGVVWQGGGVEGQDGTILLVGCIVAEVEEGGRRIECAAEVAVLSSFQDLAVEGTQGLDGQGRPGDRHVDDDAGRTAEAV